MQQRGTGQETKEPKAPAYQNPSYLLQVYETALQALNQLCQRLRIFERHQALPLLETMEQAPNDWEGMLRATIRVLAIAGKYDELLKALKLKAQLEQSGNAEGMYEKALLSLEV